MRWVARLVTLLVVAAMVAGVGWLVRGRVGRQRVGQGFRAYALFRDASRIAVESPVMIAGVRVGEVEALSIVPGGLARVELRLRDDVALPAETWATKRATSLFGDSYVELLPGGPRGDAGDAGDAGAERGPRLASGARIPHVVEGSSTDEVLRAIDRAVPRVERGLAAAQDAVGAGRRWAEGPATDTIARVDRWALAGGLDGPLDRAVRAMTALDGWTARAATAVADARASVPGALDRFDDGLRRARGKMADARAGLHDALAGVRGGLDRVDPAIRDLGEALAEADGAGPGGARGGALARLIGDDELGAALDEGTAAAAEATASVDRLRSAFGLRAEVGLLSGVPRVYVTAELRARRDKFVLVEAQRDPYGGVPQVSLTDRRGGTFTRAVVLPDTPRITAQLGKEVGRFRLRAGLRESMPGVGLDAFLGGGLRLDADVAGTLTRLPRLRVAASFEVLRWAYLVAGVDEALTTPGTLSVAPWPGGFQDEATVRFRAIRYGRDAFAGVNLTFSDEDLASFVRIFGALIVTLGS